MLKHRACIASFLTAFLALYVGFVVMARGEVIDQDVAIRKAVVTVSEDKLNPFFDQMRAFAEKYGFAVRIAPTAPTGKDFIVELWREDFKILAANPFDKGSFRVSVFNISGRPIEEKYVDEVLLNFKAYSLNVDGATFLEQPGNQEK